MVDYKELYFRLFAGIADAVDALDESNYGQAKELLIFLMHEAEDTVISEEK